MLSVIVTLMIAITIEMIIFNFLSLLKRIKLSGNIYATLAKKLAISPLNAGSFVIDICKIFFIKATKTPGIGPSVNPVKNTGISLKSIFKKAADGIIKPTEISKAYKINENALIIPMIAINLTFLFIITSTKKVPFKGLKNELKLHFIQTILSPSEFNRFNLSARGVYRRSGNAPCP